MSSIPAESIRLARSGDPVLIVGKRAAASLVDPKNEARQWLQSVERQLKQSLYVCGRPRLSVARLVVLGVGSGYHIAELADWIEQNDLDHQIQIHAFDNTKYSVEFCREHVFANRSEFPVVTLSKSHDYRPQRGDLLLRHKFSQIFSPEYFQTLEQEVAGRSRGDFQRHLSARPELGKVVDTGKLTASSPHLKLISVKTLIEAWTPTHQASESRQLFRALEELVK